MPLTVAGRKESHTWGQRTGESTSDHAQVSLIIWKVTPSQCFAARLMVDGWIKQI